MAASNDLPQGVVPVSTVRHSIPLDGDMHGVSLSSAKGDAMSNPFDTSGPSTLKFKQKTLEQIRKDAERKNREATLCNFVPPEKAQKLRKASI